MIVSEKAKVHINNYPFAEKLNPVLHRLVVEKSNKEDFGAIMTDWESFDVQEFKLIGDYATNLIEGWNREIYTPTRSHGLILNNMWGQWYRKGDYQISHAHYPNQWSFVYYINTPK